MALASTGSEMCCGSEERGGEGKSEGANLFVPDGVHGSVIVLLPYCVILLRSDLDLNHTAMQHGTEQQQKQESRRMRSNGERGGKLPVGCSP
jgi:hypothetical protein